ncbi:gluconokinase [Arundinibacter roseus]|uniref:Carbohydrate kinase n=1 Tax=Arundinibacter roseus TaxID=2070510 RepID=A0A4R4K4I8_9BACT|nr:gluconokinase [Arundinibacter roseus]TDB62298.1 carbohydrate kinase [Arundinibacter roseus]
MSYIIGADVGTTNVKAVAFSLEGSILCVHSEEYAMYHPQPDWSEQDPDEILNALIHCLQKVHDDCEPHGALLGISFSAAMHSLIAVDRQGNPLSKSIIWADNRSAQEAEMLRNSPEGERMYHSNGTPIHAMSPACKLLWLRKNEPALYRKTDRFVGIKEYIIFKLTGKFLIDYSIASATGLFNIRTLAWDEPTLAFLQLPVEKLSKPVSAYHTERLGPNNLLGFPASPSLILGASDGCLANLGSGAFVPGTMAVTVGTSGAVRICAPAAYTDDAMRTFCYLLDQHTYVIGGASNNGAVVFQWLKETFFKEIAYEDLFKAADEVAVGCDGLLCLPYWLGERAPLWNSAVRGGFVGLDTNHTTAHFVRAVMEGILLNLFSIGKILTENHPIHTIYANGGFARSETWVQMLADIFGQTVYLNDTVETGSVGAAMVGLKALGYLREYKEIPGFIPVEKIIEPNLERHAAYAELYARFTVWAQEANRLSLPHSSLLSS